MKTHFMNVHMGCTRHGAYFMSLIFDALAFLSHHYLTNNHRPDPDDRYPGPSRDLLVGLLF